MTFKEYFDKYLYCGKLDGLKQKAGCGSSDWSVYGGKDYPPFLKDVVCNSCGTRYTVVVKDLCPKGKFLMSRRVIEKLREIGRRMYG